MPLVLRRLATALVAQYRAGGHSSGRLRAFAAHSGDGKAFLSKEALAALPKGTAASAQGYHRAIFAASRSQKWDLAVYLLEEMLRGNSVPRAASFAEAISACARGRQWQQALIWFDAMKTHNVPRGKMVFTNVISCVGKAKGQWEVALGLVTAMQAESVLPDVVVYNACITACEKNRVWRPALDLLDTIKRQRLTPTVVSYSACISACEKGRAPWPAALKVLDELEGSGIAPNVIAYNAAISAMAASKQWVLALGLLARMSEREIPPDLISFNSCITACEKSGSQWPNALALLQSMRTRRVTPDVVSYSACISALEKGGGHWHAALHLLREMQRQPHIVRNVFPYNAAISVCEKHREWQQAFRVLEDMKIATVSPDVYSFNAAISACEKSGAWIQALDLFSRMMLQSVAPDVITFNALISACEKRREWTHAIKLFEVMQTPKYGSLQPGEITFSALMSACEKARQWRTAVDILCSMETFRVRPTVRCYNACISACEKAREWESALKLMGTLIHSGCKPDDISVHALLSACEKGRQWRQCLQIIKDTVAGNSIRPNVMFFNVAISAMKHMDAPDWDRWRQGYTLYESMQQLGIAPVALTYTNLLRLLPQDQSETGVAEVKAHCRLAVRKWAASPTATFIATPIEAVELLQEVDGVPAFRRAVYDMVFPTTVEALRSRDVDALYRFGLPNLGPFTREALHALGIVEFDASDARRQAKEAGAQLMSEDVRAKEVVAHIRAQGVDRVVKFGSITSDALPAVYLDHDRSGHAERQALLQVQGVKGEVELYVTHRPCLSCIAAMVAFQTPDVTLKVVFDELDIKIGEKKGT